MFPENDISDVEERKGRGQKGGLYFRVLHCVTMVLSSEKVVQNNIDIDLLMETTFPPL